MDVTPQMPMQAGQDPGCTSIPTDRAALKARSMGERTAEALQSARQGWVLGMFRQNCDLVSDRGDVVVLAWGEAQNGPLNVLLDAPPPKLTSCGTRWTFDGCCLTVGADPKAEKRGGMPSVPASGRWTVDLGDARSWDARPDWDQLGARRAAVLAAVPSLGSTVGQWPVTRLVSAERLPWIWGDWLRAARHVVTAQRDADPLALSLAAQDLCGLGPGLTPAGDDWLAGWLLGLWLVDWPAQPTEKAMLVLQRAATQTNRLSQAFLACAAAGEADENWHGLLDAMARWPDENAALVRFASAILARGATSGFAMLTGFLAALGWVEPADGVHRE